MEEDADAPEVQEVLRVRQVIFPKRRTTSGWSELSAPSETSDLWVGPEWEGKPELGPWMTGDGQRVVDVIANGHIDTLPYRVWFEQSPDSRGARHGDLLWVGGLPIGIVSDRFIEVLKDLGVTGWSTYMVEIRDAAGDEITGYMGFVADVTGDSEVVSWAWKKKRQMPLYLTTDRVADALLAAGVDRLERKTATQRLPRR